ncbi:DUF1569 domain-containing protein [Nitritalea halalkaliphila]|uniref:DUF1569 domain-containing protein n=1 Tax=Nitritalea halalkaliphila TaxID=590849 RepID=UPI000A044B8B|nr:DUF1569 domain-containing protein [Nitritalea halalkaliphila]
MNVVEMCAHCALVADKVLTWDKPLRPATWKQRLAKYYFLYLQPRFPKHVKVAEPLLTQGKVDDLELSEAKAHFSQRLRAFMQAPDTIRTPHPFFGPLNKKEWGIVLFKHSDHHLRQFGR